MATWCVMLHRLPAWSEAGGGPGPNRSFTSFVLLQSGWLASLGRSMLAMSRSCVGFLTLDPPAVLLLLSGCTSRNVFGL